MNCNCGVVLIQVITKFRGVLQSLHGADQLNTTAVAVCVFSAFD
jgi:hypothetical protein